MAIGMLLAGPPFMSFATPTIFSASPSAYVDLREIECFLSRKLESLEESGRRVDSSDFLIACAEVRQVLADGLRVLERRGSGPRSAERSGAGRSSDLRWVRQQDDAVTLELALALDRFLLDVAEELA